MTTQLSIAIIILTVSILFSIRNIMVYDFRHKLLKEVFSGEDWREKEKEFDNVSYDKMLFMFWRPLGSFYKTLGKQ